MLVPSTKLFAWAKQQRPRDPSLFSQCTKAWRTTVVSQKKAQPVAKTKKSDKAKPTGPLFFRTKRR